MANENYPEHTQHFEVVLLKEGVDPEQAGEGDFSRVHVTARDPVEAMQHEKVTAAASDLKARPIVATAPGLPTGFETMARVRSLNSADNTRNW